MRAIETVKEIRSCAEQWQNAFGDCAAVIGKLDGREVLWHETLQLWGCFSKTHGKGGITRDWNAFGQKPYAFHDNIVVEINQPPNGIDRSLQAVFARATNGSLWLLHQGRMSISGSRVTEADFIAATGLKPDRVKFSDGTVGAYHRVAQIDARPRQVQESIGAFIEQCARARTVKFAAGTPVPDLGKAQAWERGFTPEAIGTFEIAARDAKVGNRRHGQIQRALAKVLEQRSVPHSNDRVGQYGPDLFTYGDGPKVLFEIKSAASPSDIFAATGQLHIYDHLLGGGFRKVLVVPEGMGAALRTPIKALKIDTLEFRMQGSTVTFDAQALAQCLK